MLCLLVIRSFFTENRESIQNDVPAGSKAPSITKEASQRWRAMSDAEKKVRALLNLSLHASHYFLQPYVDRCEAEWEAYRKAKAEFKATTA